MIRCFLVTMVLLSLTSAGYAAAPTGPSPAPAKTGPAKILVLTGNEYPRHKWQETAPLIAQFLAADRRLTAEVKAEPPFLASADLHKYDAIVLSCNVTRVGRAGDEPGSVALGCP